MTNKETTKNGGNNKLGELLTEMRLTKGYSQRKLAQLAGITNTTVNGIENGKSSPSVNTLERILLMLDCDLASFFVMYNGELKRDIHTVIKADELIDISTGEATFKLVHNGNPNRQLAMLIETYPPHSQTEERITHEGEEVGTVISGQITILLDKTQYQLKTGDSYVFDTSIPHTFINDSDEETRIVSAHSPTTY